MSQVFGFGPYRLDPGRRELRRGDQLLGIGSRAFDILLVLVERGGQVLSNQELLALVWRDSVVDIGSLRVHMAALRKVLGDGQTGQRYIANIPLRGYTFVAPVELLMAAAPPAAPQPEARPPSVDDQGPALMQSLPALLTRLLGRDELIAELRQRVPERRCVSLVGPGGIGKTSVAISVAQALAARYEQQIAFVELAALREGSQVCTALASALQIGLLAADPIKGLSAYLRDKRLLIVLDNCEQVIAAVAALVEGLLGGAPRVDVLATSREPLRIQGEWVQRLASLPVPPSTVATLGEAMDYAAAQLLVERIAASGDALQLSDADAPAVGEICRRLDGIPLAIELAAASVEQLGLRGLAGHLEERLSVLRRGRRTALPRHQTLRATLDWSHGLLSAPEQAVLRRLALFRGYFSLESALQLCASPAGEAAIDVAEALSDLLDKSLIAADVTRQRVEYRLLELTREYALEKLLASGELDLLQQRHAAHVRALLERAESQREGMAQPAWLADHGRRIDDVRAAIAWALATDAHRATGAALLAASAPLWFALSLMAEFRAFAEQALSGGALDPLHEMKICEALGHALWHTRGDGPAMSQAFCRAQQIAEQQGVTPYQLRALWGLWLICNSSGNYQGSADLALRFGETAAAAGIAEAELTHQRMMALGLHYHGQQARARGHAQHVLEHPVTVNHTARNSGFQFDQRVAALTVLARILWIHGRPEQALRHAHLAVEEALAAEHALSLCYALANGVVPVMFWAGAESEAARYTRLLSERATEHSLVFWQAFGAGYQLLLDRRQSPASAPGLAALTQPGVSLLLLETLCTVDGSLMDERLRARADSGLGGWCAAELLRVRAEQTPAPDERERLLLQALGLAREQQALAWELRCCCSLVRLWGGGPRAAEGQDLLQAALARFSEGLATPDQQAALALRR